MFIHHSTKGIVLRERDFKESDRFFTIYTKEFGKLVLLAKAVRKIKSKLRGGLNLFSLTEIEFIQGKAYKTLTDARTAESFRNIKDFLIKLKIAYKIAEIVDNLIKERERDENVWNLLEGTFRELNKGNSLNRDLKAYHYFFWNFIDFAGFRPSIERCPFCREKLNSGILYFNAEQGGVICEKCLPRGEKKISKKVSLDFLKILKVIFKKDKALLYKVKMKKGNLEELKEVSEYYYSFLLQELIPLSYNKVI